MDTRELAARGAIVAQCRAMNAAGLNQGSSGNISVRFGADMLITPTSTPYDVMTPQMIAAMPIEGDYGAWRGPKKPSSEWRFHLDILRARPQAGAIVHAHAPFCTALAIARKDIPPIHYMIAHFGGPDIRCGGYALYGTPELSAAALAALEGRNGCLLANHGMIVVGRDLDHAMWLAVELETLARQYWHALQIGGPVLLSEREIAEAAEKFGLTGYGRS